MSKKNPRLQFLKTAILKVLKHQNTGLNIKQISWGLNLKGSEYQKIISRAIKELKKDGLIIELEKYKYLLAKVLTSGVIDINKSGNGYVKSGDYDNDIFISNKNLLNALNGDIVSIKLLKNTRTRLTGKVMEVIKRKNVKLLGVIEEHKNDAFFTPDNIKVGSHFFIPKKNLNNAKNNNRVIIEFVEWPLNAKSPVGRVISIISNQHSLKTEIESNIELFNIRHEFPKKVTSEVKKIKTEINQKVLKSRKDLRDVTTFTIDPDDAKDFDDAISIQYVNEKLIEIGIHIADVSHYVPLNSETDKEAFLRAFSIYLPGRVIPMLPEELSNEICSLNPSEDKLCFSVLIKFNIDLNKIESTWIGKTIVSSDKRFTYEEAEKLIMKQKTGKFNKELITLNIIAKNLRKKRIKNGSIDFERSDIYFELDAQNEPIKVIKKQSLSSHRLVEEFMLLANKIIATKLSVHKNSIYRVHDLPDKEKLKEVIMYVKSVSKSKVDLNLNHKKLHVEINALLNDNTLESNKDAIINLILRSMAKAIYSTKNIGHYGLGFEKYTHFTSPIRRYADLVVHRLLDSVLCEEKMLDNNLESQCLHFSNTEKKYVDIERKTTKFAQLLLLKNSTGNAFRGVITGLVKWGLYVDIEGGLGEGMVPYRELSKNGYYYNDMKHAFINKKSGVKYMLGQALSVEIVSINLFKQEMDLSII